MEKKNKNKFVGHLLGESTACQSATVLSDLYNDQEKTLVHFIFRVNLKT